MSQNVVDLDVRDLLRSKQDPFEVIMSKVETLKEDEVLQLHTTFEPAPLLKVMKKKGFDNTVEQIEEDHFIVTFTRAII